MLDGPRAIWQAPLRYAQDDRGVGHHTHPENRVGELAQQTDIAPVGSRQLGLRVKPVIRLGMGERTENGGVRMLDHFTVRGDDRAVAAFTAAYPEGPKALDIVLPATLDQALRIEYVAFKGGAEHGTMVARGETNFALRDHAGGPDLLTVWNKDGTVVNDVPTEGLDAMTRERLDPIAQDLGLELQTTLRAMLPDVLAFGEFFEISTKGKESTDNLWFKLRQLYGFFGSAVTFAVRPQLVLRESTMRPMIGEGAERRRIKKPVWVLDVVSRETLDQMFARLEERGGALSALAPPRMDERQALPAGVGNTAEDEQAMTPPAPSRLSSEEEVAAAPPEPSAAADRGGDLSDQQDEPTQAAEVLRQAVEQAKAYQHAPPILELEDETVDFSGADDRWMGYTAAYMKKVFKVEESKDLRPDQKRQLAAHLVALAPRDDLDDIPF